MSFQAYLDNAEKQTGKTPAEFVALAREKGFDTEAKTMVVVAWLKEDFGLGHGHAMALTHVIKGGAKISDKHVGKGGAHGDEIDMLRLDGLANR